MINQRAEDGEPVNQPLVIPDKLLLPAPLEFEVKYMEEQIIRNKPVRFAVYHLGKRNSMISKYFTHTWALATSLLVTTAVKSQIIHMWRMKSKMIVKSSKVNLTVKTPEIPTTLFFSVQTRIPNGGKLAKEEVMPTWSATKSLLLSQSSQSHGRTNTKVIAPLFRTSPTNHIRSVCQYLA